MVSKSRVLAIVRTSFDFIHSPYIHTIAIDIFVTGLVGTGKKTTVRQILERFPTVGKELHDSLFVYNFKKPDVPRYLSLPVGDGKKFKQVLHTIVGILTTCRR